MTAPFPCVFIWIVLPSGNMAIRMKIPLPWLCHQDKTLAINKQFVLATYVVKIAEVLSKMRELNKSWQLFFLNRATPLCCLIVCFSDKTTNAKCIDAQGPLLPTRIITKPALTTLMSTSLLIRHQGAVSIRKTVLPGMAIPMLKIRRPNGRLIFNMEIAIRR